MTSLSFKEYVTCFRKQFVFQNGKGGKRICRYYTANNSEQNLKCSEWAIMVFIHCGNKIGFSDPELLQELKIKQKLFDILKLSVQDILYPDHHEFNDPHDQNLSNKIKVKTGLVENAIRATILVNKIKL